MKDFCEKEQIFFNEDDRIRFLQKRSKNHHKHYRNLFNHTTEIIFGKDFKDIDDSDDEVKKQIRDLEWINPLTSNLEESRDE